MIKRLFKSIREYKLSSILTFIFILGEAVIECIIPFITAKLINRIELGSEMGDLIKTGVLLVVMAMASLACGGIAGVTCSKASSGFAKIFAMISSQRSRPIRLKISTNFLHHRSLQDLPQT